MVERVFYLEEPPVGLPLMFVQNHNLFKDLVNEVPPGGGFSLVKIIETVFEGRLKILRIGTGFTKVAALALETLESALNRLSFTLEFGETVIQPL